MYPLAALDRRYTTLLDFFQRLFGPKGSRRLNKARQCFVESMAAYSIVCYLLQVPKPTLHIDVSTLALQKKGKTDSIGRACRKRRLLGVHTYPPRLRPFKGPVSDPSSSSCHVCHRSRTGTTATSCWTPTGISSTSTSASCSPSPPATSTSNARPSRYLLGSAEMGQT